MVLPEPQVDLSRHPAVISVGDEISIRGWLMSLRSQNTKAAYQSDLAKFVEWVSGHGATLSDVTATAVEAWASDLLKHESSSTVARRIAAVSSYFSYVTKPGRHMEGRLNPASSEMITRVKPSSRPAPALTAKEAAALVAASRESEWKPRDEALVMLLATTGLRVSELCAANVGDISQTRGHQVLTVVGKGNKVRSVPIDPTVAVLIGLDRLADEPLILNNQQSRLNRYQVNRILVRLQAAAGIDTKITPHVLRSTCVTEALAAGAPLWAVQDLAGHADPRTTRGYQQRGQSVAEGAAMVAGLAARFAG